MRFLGRLILLILGLIFAIPAGAVTLALGIFSEPAAQQLVAMIGTAVFDLLFSEAIRNGDPDVVFAEFAMGFAFISLVLLVAPVSFVAICGEVTGTRSLIYYGVVTGLITAAIPWLMRGGYVETPALEAEWRITALLFVTGAVAGFVYWLITGRSAGRRRAPKGAETPAERA
ncbi:MAG: hypothetical protein ACXIVE_09670 [Salinarimonas sp.]